MSEMLDTWEKMIETASLEKLKAYQKALLDEFRRRVKANMPPHKIFFLTMLSTALDVEIKEREHIQRK